VEQTLVFHHSPSAQEHRPLELSVVSCALKQVTHESLLVQVAQELWQVSQSKLLF
jgi:hypothetical protein